MSLYTLFLPSPLGTLRLVATTHALRSISFDESALQHAAAVDDVHAAQVLEQCAVELSEYFEAKRRHFSVPLQPEGTRFEQRVWTALQSIPFGSSTSYGDVARACGNAKSVRAVASANARNAIALIIPCHRVVGRDGKLRGYNGGLWRKEWLLRHEGVLL